MRVLVTTSPGLGHTFATIPLSWALRAAGHEVLFATAGRLDGDLPAVLGAGVQVAEIATREQMERIRAGLRARRQAEADRLGVPLREMVERDLETARQARHVRDGNGWVYGVRIFGPMSAGTLDGLVGVATRWKPDLVVHESMQGGGPLVAALLGVPAVEHPIGFARGPQVVEAMAAYLADEYARFGVSGPPERTVALDVSPPSMGVGPAYGWPMRYVPFNGGGLVTDWLTRPAGRPRIAVTLGSILAELGFGPFGRIIEAAGQVDADFLLTVDAADLSARGPLPPNVHACGYVPLGAMLGSCDAIVHHGGSSTTFTALDAGVPQLVLPELADQFINADAVARRGCGLVAEHDVLDAALLGALAGDDAMRVNAAQVRAELATMPSPVQVAARLVEFAT